MNPDLLNPDLVLPAILFVVFFIAALLFLLAAPRKEETKLKQRLDVVREGLIDPAAGLLVRQKHLQNLRPFERTLEELPGMGRLALLSEQAGKPVVGYRAALLMLFLAAATGFLVYAITQRAGLALLLAGIALVLYPLNLWLKKNERRKRFEEQLPDALDMMARALRAGNPLTESFRFAAEEMDAPISQEFATTWQHLTYGLNLKIALEDLSERMPSTSLQTLVTAILVQRETGGNLAEILDKISAVLRTKFRFERKLRSLTAEGRISAKVLISMPFLLAGALMITSPSYLKMMTDDENGRRLMVIALILMAIGALWIRKIVKIRF